MSRFFIDRPIFAWVIALVIMLAGGLSISKLARRAVSRYCAATSQHHRELSRCVCADFAGYGDPGHRAANEGYRWHGLHVLDQRFLRTHGA